MASTRAPVSAIYVSTSAALQSSSGDDDDDDSQNSWIFAEDKFATYTRIKGVSSAPAFYPRSPVHVGGTPGTGKTAFGLYLLHKLLCRYPTYAFVYRHG